MSGTKLSNCPRIFEQVAQALENARRYAISPITKFLLSSTGLDEAHFRGVSPNPGSRAAHATSHGPNWSMDPTSRRRGGGLGDALEEAENLSAVDMLHDVVDSFAKQPSDAGTRGS